MAKAKSPVPEGFHTVTPHLILDNTAQAIEWYKKALGAEEKSSSAGPDGKIIHAEIQIGNSRVMLADEFTRWEPAARSRWEAHQLASASTCRTSMSCLSERLTPGRRSSGRCRTSSTATAREP